MYILSGSKHGNRSYQTAAFPVWLFWGKICICWPFELFWNFCLMQKSLDPFDFFSNFLVNSILTKCKKSVRKNRSQHFSRNLSIPDSIVKILTEMKSALNYRDCDIKYVFVHVPESCLNIGWTTDCQPRFLFHRRYLCAKAYLTFCTKSQDSE